MGFGSLPTQALSSPLWTMANSEQTSGDVLASLSYSQDCASTADARQTSATQASGA